MATLILVSDDSGTTWALSESTEGDPRESYRVQETSPLFFVVDKTQPILRTRDGGELEWFSDPLPGSAISGLAYDFRPDELYVQYPGGEVFGLKRASQVDAGLANAAVSKAVDADTIGAGAKDDGVIYWVRYPDGVAPDGSRAIISTVLPRP